ncbi:MAG: ankyrin repeat domain-containing protein, partial [Lawsonibacter sp.]|nr:ankyrin repeat domain-containing protein [Lawsonibacter sp.]
MSLLPIKKGINFSGMELYEILLKVDFDALVEFLNSRGGLNGVEEYGRTALMELTIGRVRDTVESWNRQEGGLYAQEGRNELMRAFFLRCQDFSLEYLLQFENEFAQKLVDLGCDINQRDRYGYTALRYAVQDKNYAMAEYLLSRPGVELQDVTPSMDDRMDSILVRGGCDIFT